MKNWFPQKAPLSITSGRPKRKGSSHSAAWRGSKLEMVTDCAL